MTKTILLGIPIAVVLIAGLLAFMPIQEASSAGGTRGNPNVRDNLVVTGLTTADSTASLVGAIVLLDNAGRGGTSDVEITWTAPFSDTTQCKLVTVGGISSLTSGTDPNGNKILGNDLVFKDVLGYNVAHNDVTGTQAILLVDIVVGGGGCSLGSDYISISTVASHP